jgi:DNA (cytosine-5)-methyltransferase 1
MGLHRAGFNVVGIDIRPRPLYPFSFIEADALAPPVDLRAFDLVWASPPCQGYSWSAKRWATPRADHVAPTRAMLIKAGVPWVIENVRDAPVRPDLVLTGLMFGLGVIRRRLFECSFFVMAPPHPPKRGSVIDGTFVTVAGHGGHTRRGRGSRASKAQAMGIDWMRDDLESLNEAVPPAYAEFIGRSFLNLHHKGDRQCWAQGKATG